MESAKLQWNTRYFGPDGDLTEPFVLEAGRLRVAAESGIHEAARAVQLVPFHRNALPDAPTIHTSLELVPETA